MVNITMSGPGKNSLGTEMMQFLLAKLDEAAGNPVLLTGAGDAFSAGLNLKEVAGMQPAGMQTFLELLERLFTTLYLYPGPTVALVNGHAVAGGCVLALCCDHRVALDQPKVRIGLNEVALGLRFPPRTLAICRRRVPRRHHEEVLLGAGLFDPRNAQRLGLVDEASVDPASAAAAVMARVEGIPADAYAATKRDLRGASPTDLCTDDEQKRRLAEMLPTWTSPEVKQRVLAVLSR